MTEAPDGVVIPDDFLAEMVSRSSDLAGLKITLQVVRLSSRGRESVPLSDLIHPDVARQVVGAHSPEPAEERLQRALERAIADDTLLALVVGDGGDAETHYLPATTENRRLVQRTVQGDGEAVRRLRLESAKRIAVRRPNIFALYERHIGPLTPLVAEQLRDVERSYPRAWIEEAIETAVQYNRRNWRYIHAILRRWEQAGGPGAPTGSR